MGLAPDIHAVDGRTAVAAQPCPAAVAAGTADAAAAAAAAAVVADELGDFLFGFS